MIKGENWGERGWGRRGRGEGVKQRHHCFVFENPTAITSAVVEPYFIVPHPSCININIIVTTKIHKIH